MNPRSGHQGNAAIPTVNAGQVHFLSAPLPLPTRWWNCLWCNWFSTTKLVKLKKKNGEAGTLLCCQSCYKRIWSFWKAICWVKWWQICLCFDLFMLLTRIYHRGLPWWPSGWESAYQWVGHGFNPWPRNQDPTFHRAISHVTAIEAVLSRAHDLQQEATTARNPYTTTREQPCSLQLKKAQVQQGTPSTANILIN